MKRLSTLLLFALTAALGLFPADASAGGCPKGAAINPTWTEAWSQCPSDTHRIVVELVRRSDGVRVVRRGPWTEPGLQSAVWFNNNRFIWVDWWVRKA